MNKIKNSVAERAFSKYFHQVPDNKIVTKEMTLEYGEAVADKMVDRFLELLKLRWRHLLLEKERADVEGRESVHVHGRMQEAGFLRDWIMRQQRDYNQDIDHLIEYETEKVKYLKNKKVEQIMKMKSGGDCIMDVDEKIIEEEVIEEPIAEEQIEIEDTPIEEEIVEEAKSEEDIEEAEEAEEESEAEEVEEEDA